jgi:hypothetical protein
MFGLPAVILFLATIFWLLSVRRRVVSWVPVVLAVFTGEFAYGNPLSFLGSVIFFGAQAAIILNELGPEPRHDQAMRPVRPFVLATWREAPGA